MTNNLKRVHELTPGDRLQAGRIKKALSDITNHSEGLKTDLLKRVNEMPIESFCSVFGCGKTLTIREKMFGDKCVLHNGTYPQKVNKTHRIFIGEQA